MIFAESARFPFFYSGILIGLIRNIYGWTDWLVFAVHRSVSFLLSGYPLLHIFSKVNRGQIFD